MNGQGLEWLEDLLSEQQWQKRKANKFLEYPHGKEEKVMFQKCDGVAAQLTLCIQECEEEW